MLAGDFFIALSTNLSALLGRQDFLLLRHFQLARVVQLGRLRSQLSQSRINLARQCFPSCSGANPSGDIDLSTNPTWHVSVSQGMQLASDEWPTTLSLFSTSSFSTVYMRAGAKSGACSGFQQASSTTIPATTQITVHVQSCGCGVPSCPQAYLTQVR